MKILECTVEGCVYHHCGTCVKKDIDCKGRVAPRKSNVGEQGYKGLQGINTRVNKHGYAVVLRGNTDKRLFTGFIYEIAKGIYDRKEFNKPVHKAINIFVNDVVTAIPIDKIAICPSYKLAKEVSNSVIITKDTEIKLDGKKLAKDLKGHFEKEEMVEHPSHYNTGNIEVIEAINDWELNFNLGNAIKYIARCNHKGNKKEDLKKALFYIKHELNKEVK